MDELERIRRQNRKFFLVLSFFIALILLGLVLSYFRPTPTTVKNYVGKNGVNGQDAKVDYSVLFSLIDNRIAALPTPRDGKDGAPGAPSTVPGPKGNDSTTPGPVGADSTVPGPTGNTGEQGAPGRSPEFQCDSNTHNYQWRYAGDEDWKVLQPNSKACTENE